MAEPHVQNRMQSADKNGKNAGHQPHVRGKTDSDISRLIRLSPVQTTTPVMIGRKSTW